MFDEAKNTNCARVKFDRRNYRKHDDRNKKLIRKSLEELGAGRSVVIDAEDELIAGNGVYEQAEVLGLKTRVIETDGSELVIVKRTDLHTDDEKRRKLALADNATSDTSTWDVDALKADWEPEELDEWVVECVWEDEPEPVSGETEPDAVPEIFEDEKPVSVRGKVYQLGEHRLMCGDSTSADDVAKLMNGEKAALLLTDPPYGIKCDKGIKTTYGTSAKNEYKYSGDWDDGVIENIGDIVGYADRAIVFGANYFANKLPIGTHWIVWDKTGDIDFKNPFSDCELAWSNFDKVITKKYTVIQQGFVNSDTEKRVHPTQKPIKLLGEMLPDYSSAGDLVLDLFGGSGSTLIACEQTKRKARLMELDEHYCDVIRKRWAEFVHGEGCNWEKLTPEAE